MINNSVSKAYFAVDEMAKQIERINNKDVDTKDKKQRKKKSKKGLLSRSDDMFKYNNPMTTEADTGQNQQKLVTAYVVRIRQAFKEVKNGRTNTKS
tara:strand:- start:299 stop:586 length:288 start_codon:yes stop_codon:yes gene_type:complete